jgi:hypothetical protein
MNERQSNFKNLSVLESIRKRWELQMETQIIELASGFILIATALVKMGLEHRSDVLHGPYLSQGQKKRARFWPRRGWRSVDIALHRFRMLEAMRQPQLASGAC